MRTTLDIHDDLMRRAKTFAAESGRTLTGVVEDALREVLSRRERHVDRKQEPLAWPTLNLGAPLPGVDLDNSAALLDLMEQDDDPV